MVFPENQHREDDAIDGLQIVGEVDRESVNLLQDNDLQQTQPDSANHHHKGHIGIVHACRKELPDRQDGVVNRQDDAEDNDAADHLPEEHILGLIVLADVLVGDGEQGVQGRGDNSQGNAQTVSGVELEDEIDAAYREDAEQELAHGEAVPVDDGLEKRGEESDQGEADHSDGDVRCLDAGVEEDPVQAQQHAHAAHPGHILETETLHLFSEDKKQRHQGGRPRHPMPYEHHGIQLDEPSQHPGEPRDEHGEVQQQEAFMVFCGHYKASNSIFLCIDNTLSAILMCKNTIFSGRGIIDMIFSPHRKISRVTFLLLLQLIWQNDPI